MKVKTIVTFKDLKAKTIRKAGEEFECSEERFAEILKKGKYVKPIVEQPEVPENTEDAEIAPAQKEPESEREKEEPEQAKARKKTAKSGKQAKKEEEGDR